MLLVLPSTYKCKFLDCLQKHGAHSLFVFLSVLLSRVWEICRQQSCKRSSGGRGEKGVQKCSSPAWTSDPQCGVPVHILKHHDCLLIASFCPLLPHFYQFFYFYFHFFVSCALTSPNWSFSRHCSSKQMSQAGLTLLLSSLFLCLSLCIHGQQTASPRGAADKRGICHSHPISPPCPIIKGDMLS